MSTNYFGKTAAEMAAMVAAQQAEMSRREQARWDAGLEDDSFISQKCESLELGEMKRAADLAALGWRMGFVGLRRVDGTCARGRWIDSKWRGRLAAWGTPKVNGERGLDFIPGELLLKSRAGDQKACDKLRALGFEWVTGRCRVNSRRTFPTGRGLEGLYFAGTYTFPCDEHGNEILTDALCYPAEEFFVDEAADLKWELTMDAEDAAKAA